MNSQKSHDAASGAPPWDNAASAFDAWRSGKPGAIDELVHLMTPVLWQVVRAYRLDHEASEDVIQFTWLTLVRKRDTIENPQAVGQWLLITARRQAWRVSQNRQRDEPTEDDVLASALPAHGSAEADSLLADDRRVLWAAVQQLPERCQRLLRVVAFDDRPNYKALAEDLGLAVGSIGATRRRCLDNLKNILGERS